MTEDGVNQSSSNPEQLFDTLANILTELDLSEIAIAPYILPLQSPSEPSPSTSPSSHRSWSPREIYPFTLLEQDKLVVPQKPLYAIFAYAIRSLAKEDTSYLYATEQSGPRSIPDRASERLDRCTKIILLQNPEHIRALNVRKRLVPHRLAKGKDSVVEVIERELHYTSLVLGIAANAKMATLWHHRRWLLSLQYADLPRFRPSSSSSSRTITRWKNVGMALSQDILDSEIALVDRSAQRYPRNYQAWAYRSWLFSTSDIGSLMMEAEFTAMSRHLTSNVTDHTAVVHVLQLLEGRGSEQQWEAMRELAVELVERYSHRETPWLFLRGLVQLSHGDKQEVLSQQAQQLAERIAKKTRDSMKGDKDGPDWQQAQDVKALNLSKRTLFFLRAKNDVGHGLGSAEARVVLDSCRI